MAPSAANRFTRGRIEIEVRTDDEGRITRAVRTAPDEPPADPNSGRALRQLKQWLTTAPTPVPADSPARFTRLHHGIITGAELVAFDRCRAPQWLRQ